MHYELTEVDIKKMREEIEHRSKNLRPKLREELQLARSYGDLSENFEYKAAKRELNRNESRIRYLERVIKTAIVITTDASSKSRVIFSPTTLPIEPIIK
jgi:transcription elongation factor GreA